MFSAQTRSFSNTSLFIKTPSQSTSTLVPSPTSPTASGSTLFMDPQALPESLAKSKVMKGWAEGLKARIDNVNAMAIVATFLAAVQAQLISFTWQSNSTSLEKAINIFSFVGLAFDIIGTATGLISALTLQPDTARIHEAVLNADESYATWKLITDELQVLDIEDQAFQGRSIPQNIFQEVTAKRRERFQRRQILDARKNTWDEGEKVRVEELEDLRRVVVVGSVKGLPPLVMMSLGIICFFVALISFLIATQPPAVWITTVAVIAISIAMLPFDALSHRWHPAGSIDRYLSNMFIRRKRVADQESAGEKSEAESKPV
ncbi:hypothetical protein SISNIDRAFT_450846 [Sistotremastrum niveocremeum HHB9708]|uniref:Uncharacterized protein n=1 Tax=Sistotremastrum niveocremeum HHB9708 TaxID=1314777 RepID=A0A164XR94_9AGAM|nr:hypothetical protein SISNIDRAFT_450846 [Sistotremastrum niveocremeum HHB9708]